MEIVGWTYIISCLILGGIVLIPSDRQTFIGLIKFYAPRHNGYTILAVVFAPMLVLAIIAMSIRDYRKSR